jgi:hypothetical protein
MPAYRPPEDNFRVLPPPVGSLLAVPLVLGSMVAVTLGVYGSLNEPTGIAVNVAGFSSPLAAKAWLTTGAVAFAVVQVISAWVMYDRVPGIPPPRWSGAMQRGSGRIAFRLAVPVAVHCLYALGCVVWRIVCDAPLYDGETTEDILKGHLHEQPSTFNPRIPVPEGLEHWLRGLVHRDIDRRTGRAAGTPAPPTPPPAGTARTSPAPSPATAPRATAGTRAWRPTPT